MYTGGELYREYRSVSEGTGGSVACEGAAEWEAVKNGAVLEQKRIVEGACYGSVRCME